MSKRTIDENLKYVIKNQGIDIAAPLLLLNAPILTITSTTPLLNGQAITTGTVTSSTNVNVSAAPGRTILAYFPRTVEFSLPAVNLVANTPLDLDFGAATTPVDRFTANPSPGARTDFITVVGGATTHFQFNTKGHWSYSISAIPTVTLGNAQELHVRILRSVNSGAVFFGDQTLMYVKGGAGTPTIDHVGGASCRQWINTAAATGVERVKFNLVCTENKTVSVSAKFTCENPTF